MNYKILIAILAIIVLLLIVYCVYNNRIKEMFESVVEEETSVPEVEIVNEDLGKSLVLNGSFQDGKDIENSGGDKLGNSIVIHPNPGKSSYVLKQTSNINDNLQKYKTRYQITVDVSKNTYYSVSCFVKNSEDYDGNDNIFYIKLYNLTQEPKTKISEGAVLFKKTVYNSLWIKKQYIFQTPPDSNEKVDILLGYSPSNTKGYRFITDISVIRYYPLLKNFPTHSKLALLLNSFDTNSYNGGKVWKDLTSSGNDFTWDLEPSLDTNDGFSLKDNKIIISKYLLNSSDFSIIFFYQGVLNNSGPLFKTKTYKLELFCNYNSCTYSFYEKNKKITWKSGIPHSRSLYILVKKGDNITFYKDDSLLNAVTSYGDDAYNEHINGFIINPDKKLSGNLSSFCIINSNVTKDYIDMLNYYFYKTVLYSNIAKKHTNIFSNPDISNYQFSSQSPLDNSASATETTSATVSETAILSETDTTTTAIIDKNKCPFKNSSQTCNSYECRNAEWSNNNTITNKCQQVINQYCNTSDGNQDESCKLYATDDKEPKCSSSRSIINQLKQPSDECQKCPDMSKYIKKDEIPCWGCNL